MVQIKLDVSMESLIEKVEDGGEYIVLENSVKALLEHIAKWELEGDVMSWLISRGWKVGY